MSKIPVIAVCGPTASGKTSLAVRLALEFGGEVVSCDSMQIYRKMDIGTAKPTVGEMQGVPHHMIDICDPDENYNVSSYAADAAAAIEDIRRRGRTVIVCGGTGLYLDTLLRGVPCAPDIPQDIRISLDKKSSGELWDELCRADPESAEATHPNNRKRVIRALEIYYGTGRTKSFWDGQSRMTESRYDCLKIGLDFRERSNLYARIDARVDMMFEAGVCDEVRSLALSPDTTAGQAIGYKEINGYINGDISLEEAKELVKQATRRYAKRQLTWFRREKDMHWFYPDENADFCADVISLIRSDPKYTT